MVKLSVVVVVTGDALVVDVVLICKGEGNISVLVGCCRNARPKMSVAIPSKSLTND